MTDHPFKNSFDLALHTNQSRPVQSSMIRMEWDYFAPFPKYPVWVERLRATLVRMEWDHFATFPKYPVWVERLQAMPVRMEWDHFATFPVWVERARAKNSPFP